MSNLQKICDSISKSTLKCIIKKVFTSESPPRWNNKTALPKKFKLPNASNNVRRRL